ncbi:E3 ubiquitin/ISG15 ligase TRIM25-like [Ascaphus truei]|uniref:E3 ubiquitin/ISG15 ligase TRIM25-like n=1 Tax=Ascaphus truei TaxID=8439 RepID=UPI003F5949B2
MASAGLREELTCPICLSIYTQPVTLRCGHNFCQGCIGSVLDTQEGSGLYTCPECRKRFQERPALQRNLKLCNIAERFLSTQPEQEEAVIFCTYCDSSVPAAKTCLQCDASLCDKHLKKHSKSVEHVLTEPTTSLKTRKCPVHKEILKYYCTKDAACICVTCCLVGKHRGHQVESLNEASEKKEKLRHVLEKLTSVREETEKRAQSLQGQKREVQEKAAGVTDRVTALIRDFRAQLEVLEKQVLSEITRWEEQVSLRVSDLIQQLEIKKDELSRKIFHIEELCNITDPLTVLQGRESDNAEDREREGNKVPAVGDLDEVLIPLTLQRLADIVTDLKAKSGFCVQGDSGILLDVNTAANDVSVSGDLKTASWSETDQLRPNTPGRFEFNQVLSTRSFSSGQHYWEVEISESGDRGVGISYPSIVRKGGQSYIGDNKKSWSLCMWDDDYLVIHDTIQTRIYPESPVQRLGIYLDYEAGRLSFYQLCDPIRHLHTVTATFTEPLHAAFCVCEKGWVRIRS